MIGTVKDRNNKFPAFKKVHFHKQDVSTFQDSHTAQSTVLDLSGFGFPLMKSNWF